MTAPRIEKNPQDAIRLVQNGIFYANRAYSTSLSPEWTDTIFRKTNQLNDGNVNLEPGNLNVVIFHVNIPNDVSQVTTPDIKNLDHASIDYETLVKLNIEISLKSNPRSRVFLLTDNEFCSHLKPHARLAIHRIRVNSREPMFERVMAMLTYSRSRLFDQPTVFLDSDAFLLRPVHNLFANAFDIGLTHRNILGQMPVNEGVIFSNNINITGVRAFFEAYLSSYLALENCQDLSKIYTNIRRWRGGQLAINSVANGGQVYRSGLTNRHELGARIVVLPCAKYNLSQIDEDEVDSRLANRVAILHLKGPRKSWINRLRLLVDA